VYAFFLSPHHFPVTRRSPAALADPHPRETGMELLSQEYFKLVDILAQYDDRLMVIKGWSITVGLALIGYAFQHGQRAILLLCCVSTLCFAFVDAKFKEYQVNYYPRMQAIEECVARPQEQRAACIPLQINSWWTASQVWYGVFLQFGKLGVLMPHFVVFILGLWLFLRWNSLSAKSQLTNKSSRPPKGGG
jgi:hypothetical protein